MRVIDMQFMGIKVVHKLDKQPVIVSDLPRVMKENDYPNELAWGCNALQAIILSHYKCGVDIDTPEYKQGLHEVFEQMLERGRAIIRERVQFNGGMDVNT